MRHLSSLIGLALFLLPPSSSAQTNNCDKSLETDTNNSFAYRQRGDRCEGLFTKTKSISSLTPRSLTTTVEDYRQTETVFLRWPSIPATTVHLRASRLKSRIYYRMDTHQPGQNSFYKWDTEIIRSEVPLTEFGVFAFFNKPAGEDEELMVLVPVSLAATNKASDKVDQYVVGLLPDTSIAEVYISLGTVNADNKISTVLSNQKLDVDPAPPDQPLSISIPVSWLPTPAIYWVKLSAISKLKKPLSAEFYFLHAPQVQVEK
ncbi:hypothetical protein NR798_10990 [Archangium gephyra]|uniref:hypothetical protein n=1 Tax=Archangium gephyra TaxID=48 RepID=UPI0035D41A5D